MPILNLRILEDSNVQMFFLFEGRSHDRQGFMAEFLRNTCLYYIPECINLQHLRPTEIPLSKD